MLAAVVVAVGGPFVYFRFVEGRAPRPLRLSDAPTTSAAAGRKGARRAALAGEWTVASGSVVRYRVEETLLGQHNTAVGTTHRVAGRLTITGTTVTRAAFTVQMATFTSNDPTGRRDGQFRGRIMDVADFPTATFTLTRPIALAPVPADGVARRYPASGRLQMHGTTRTVTLALRARRSGGSIAVLGSLPVRFSDFGIANPSGGPASVGDRGTLEVLLVLAPVAHGAA